MLSLILETCLINHNIGTDVVSFHTLLICDCKYPVLHPKPRNLSIWSYGG